MKQILRYFFVTIFAMVGLSASAEGVTINFNDYTMLFPSLPGASSSESNAGDFTTTTTSTPVSGFTVTVSVADEGASAPNRIWLSGQTPQLRMYSGTFTVKGSGIKRISFLQGNHFNLSTTTGTLEGQMWTGEADEVVFKVDGNTQIYSLEINGDDPNVPNFLSVNDLGAYVEGNQLIEGFLYFGDSKPRVTYVNGKYVYVRDTAEGYIDSNYNGMCFYNQKAFAEATNKWQLGGRIKGTPTVYNKMTQFNISDASEMTHTDVDEYQPVEYEGLKFQKEKNVANLVKFTDDLTVTKDGNKFYVLDHTLQVYDNFKLGYTLNDGDVIKGLTGVIIRYNDTYEICPTVSPTTTAINTIEADKAQNSVIYNLAGQKVENSYKGLIIKNGKKFMQK